MLQKEGENVADNNIDLTASFDASSAIKGVNDFGKAANTAVNGVNDSFNGLQKSIVKTSSTKLNIDSSSAISSLESLRGKIAAVGAGIAAYFSVQMVSGFFNTMIDESVDAQNNLNQLNAALQRTGQLTPEVSASMAKFAADLTAVSTIDDDVINGQLAIALNFTKSAEKARDLVGAAANLSSAMKIDLGTAVELLGKTLDGTAGRLNETVPALRGVSEEALKSGAAINIVNQAFAGAATAEISTYSGAMTQLSNVFGNFAASLGNMIVQNPMVAQAIKEISTAFMGATAAIEGGTSSSISFVNRGITGLISGVRDLIPSLNSVSSFMKSIAFLFDAMLKGVMSFVDGLRILGNSWLWLVGTMAGKKTALDDISQAIDRMKNRGDDLTESLKNIGKDSFSKLDLKDFDEALKRIQDSANQKPIDIQTKLTPPKIADATINWGDYINTKIEDIKIDPIKPEVSEGEVKFNEDQLARMGFENWFNNLSSSLDDFILQYNEANNTPVVLDWNEYVGLPKDGDLVTFFKKAIDGVKAASSYVWNVVPGVKAATYLITKGLFEVGYNIKKNLPSIITGIGSGIEGIISAMAQGAEGARKAIPELIAQVTPAIGGAVGSIWGTLGSTIGQALGGIVGQLVKLGAQPIGDTMKQIDEFMAEFPVILKRTVENLPTIMNKVFEQIPNILMAVLKALPAIMRASASALKPFFKEVGKDIFPIIQVLVDVVWETIAMVVMGIGYAVQGFAIGISEYFKEKFNAMLPGLSNFFSKLTNGFNTLKDKVVSALTSISMSGLIEGIGAGLDKLWSNITDVMGRFWNGLSEGFMSLVDIFDNLISSLGDFLEPLFLAVFKDFPTTILNGITDALGLDRINLDSLWDDFKKAIGRFFSMENLGSMLQKFIDGIGSIFSMENLNKMVQKFIDGIKDIFNISVGKKSDGGKGTVEKSLGIDIPYVGFAKGGIVPNGYPNDTYPSMLSSNEVVIPSQTAPNLFALIDKLAKKDSSTETNASSDETNVLLKQLIAIIANQQTHIDVKLDKDTLAKAIVSLNKDNRRLA